MRAPVVLQLPVLSSNKYWRPVPIGGHITIVPTKEAKEYKKTVQAIAKAAGITAPIEGRVKVEYMLYPHRPLDWKKRMRDLGANWDDTVQRIDLDNCAKVMLDAINGVVIVDDKWVHRLFGYLMEPDEHGERLVVRVAKIERTTPQPGLI
jgi:crossover junction endodeoxyribonuclease RusA